MLHDTLTFAVAMLCLAAIVSPRIPTGIAGSTGLALLAIAGLWSMDDHSNPFQVVDLVFVGLGLVCISVLWRTRRKRGQPLRRRTDWECSRAPPLELDSRSHRHVAGGKGGA